MGLPLWTRVKKRVHRRETHRLPGKEKVLCVAVSKEGHADAFWKNQLLLISLIKVQM